MVSHAGMGLLRELADLSLDSLPAEWRPDPQNPAASAVVVGQGKSPLAWPFGNGNWIRTCDLWVMSCIMLWHNGFHNFICAGQPG